MFDYISREDYCEENCGKENREGYKTCKNCGMLNIPSADVQPARHGRWIDCTFYDPYEKSWEQNYEFKCSNCGHKIYNKPNDDNLFCGHCNARMDLKDGDTND